MSFRAIRQWLYTGLASVAFLGIHIGAVQATVITSGCSSDANPSCTLAELVAGGAITIDDKVIDNWILNDLSTLAINSADVEVMPMDDQPLNPGLEFIANGAFSVGGSDVINILIQFSVSTVDGSARIKDNSLELNTYTFNPDNTGGVINIFEDVSDDSGNLIGDKFVTADNRTSPIFNLFDSASFSPQPRILVETFIIITGDSDLDSVSLDRFSQRFSTDTRTRDNTSNVARIGRAGNLPEWRDLRPDILKIA